MDMRQAMVSYPTLYGDNREVLKRISVPRFIITTKEQFAHHKELFKGHAIVKPLFERELAEGNTIIINESGGWCTEGEEIKIEEYLD